MPITTAHTALFGKPILPIKRVEIFSPDEWEEFVEEWLDLKKSFYQEVERFGGAGDKGRDVVGYASDKRLPDYIWDCYQCKHYKDSVTPYNVWVEFGKIVYYSFMKEYPAPRKYYIVAPKGCGTTLANLLKSQDKLKTQLQVNWAAHCEIGITSTLRVKLEGDLLDYFEKFDFSIFEKIAPKQIIEEHKAHSNHIIRFGGGLPDRPEITDDMIPSTPEAAESIYVGQLLMAYGSAAGSEFKDVQSITTAYAGHFKRSRLNFHYAEQLRNLYRDSLPTGTFEKFQEQVYDAIINTYEDSHENGYQKVKAVESMAVKATITSNPLSLVSVTKDQIGVCHQLCNENKLVWVGK